MAEGMQTSTPLVLNKFIPPPPRRLWSADSPMEQLYRNKWMQYRNSMNDKDPWNALDSPHFIDFKELPDVQDDYFGEFFIGLEFSSFFCIIFMRFSDFHGIYSSDEVEEEKISTPTSFQTQQRLPGINFENDNILESVDFHFV